MATVARSFRKQILIVGLAFLFASANAEWLSDIATANPVVERKALEARAEKFWSVLREAAEEVNLNEYEELLDSVEGIVDSLPVQNAEVAKLLRSSADRLRRTSQALFLNAIAAGETAGEKLAQGFLQKRSTDVAFSALGDVFGKAIRRFRNVDTNGGENPYDDQALRDVAERQGEVLPILRQTADVSANILTDTRLASKEARDVQKYDIYTPGAPKTPEAAEKLANKLADAARAMRHKFMAFVQASVGDIANDTASQDDSAAKVLSTTPSPSAVADKNKGRAALEHVISI